MSERNRGRSGFSSAMGSVKRTDSSSTSPSSPSPSLDSSNSSLDQVVPRVPGARMDGGARSDSLVLLNGEQIEAVYQDIAFLCPFTAGWRYFSNENETNISLFNVKCFFNSKFKIRLKTSKA